MSFAAIIRLIKSRPVRYSLTALIIGVVGLFFYQSLSANWAAVRKIDLDFNWWSVGAIALFVYAVTESGRLWGIMLKLLSPKARVSRRAIVEVQISSWLLKYIPGQAGSVVNKISWGTRHGFSKKLMLVSFIYENIFLLLGSFVVSVPILLLLTGPDKFIENPLYLAVPLGFFVASLLLLDGKFMHRIFNALFTKALKQPVDKSLFLTGAQTLRLQLYYLWPRLLNGVGFVLVALSFLTIDAKYFVPLAATYILAGAIGILAIFVPSGVGVREAVIVLFAGQFLPVEQAIILSVIARLYATLADGVLAVVYAGSKVYRK